MKTRLFLPVLTALLVLLAACAPPQPEPGRIIMAIADKTADLAGVTQVVLTSNLAQVHSDAGGWVTIGNRPVSVDLLALRDLEEVFIAANATMPEGRYTQLRLNVTSLRVFKDSRIHEAKLPSGELKFVRGFDVRAGETTAITLDFDAEKSLHETGAGQYIFLPVIRLDITHDADVVPAEGGRARIKGTAESSEHAMNEKGEVGPKETHRVPPDKEVRLEEPGTRVIPLTIYHTRYDPARIEVQKGDRVRIDALAAAGTGTESGFNHNHGVTIDEYGINVAATSEAVPTPVEFTADKEGTFAIYCKTCWDGPFGEEHPSIRAQLVVR